MVVPLRYSAPGIASEAASVNVVLVGTGRSPILDELGETLERTGWTTERAVDAADLVGRITPHHRAVVVVHAREAQLALEILEALDEMRHSVMVIVLVDRTEPGEYYCLMQAGAVQFFQVGEETKRILRGIVWAVHVLAP